MIENNTETINKGRVPDIAIIVPYRDREAHRVVFMNIMPEILKGKNYKIFFIHQRDDRPFNRGAIKNLGFLYIKKTYPLDYEDITLVFHDIDNIPSSSDMFSYQTNKGEINHFYGFKNTLGGILAIKGRDFEDINGFANIWTWGMEDNILQKRCKIYNKKIKREEFINYEKYDKNMIFLNDGSNRFISNNIQYKYKYDDGIDGIRTISNIKIDEVKEFKKNIFEVNVDYFMIPERLDSIFVKNASFKSKHEDKYLNNPVRKYKLGKSGKFGKQISHKNFMLY